MAAAHLKKAGQQMDVKVDGVKTNSWSKVY